MFESHKGGHRPDDPPKTVRELLHRSVPMNFRIGSWPQREGNGGKERPPRGCWGVMLPVVTFIAVGVTFALWTLAVMLWGELL